MDVLVCMYVFLRTFLLFQCHFAATAAQSHSRLLRRCEGGGDVPWSGIGIGSVGCKATNKTTTNYILFRCSKFCPHCWKRHCVHDSAIVQAVHHPLRTRIHRPRLRFAERIRLVLVLAHFRWRRAVEEEAVEEETRYSLSPWALEEELAVGPDTEILSLCVPQPINNILSVRP